jgi:galactose mutarotase-like enzyme
MEGLLTNGILQLRTRNKGAEMISLLDLRDGTEHLWQADPKFWAWHAPMLFPVIGACENNELRIGNKHYPMPKHGFARHTDFALIAQTPDSLNYLLASKGQFRDAYPWEFELHVHYKLQDTTLTCTYKVKNCDDQDMYFAIGGHPALSICWQPGDQISDYYLQFEKQESSKRHLINEQGLFNGQTSEVFNDSSAIALHAGLFKDDALIFKDLSSKTVELRSKKQAKYLSFSFIDYPYLGIWAVQGAPYVCIEPWQGCAECSGELVHIENKEKVLCLSPKSSVSRSFSISILQN